MTALDKIKFSFEFYDCSGKYCISGWTQEKIKKTLERLKDINTKTHNDLIKSRAVYHFGEVDWSKTEEKNGFPGVGIQSLQPFHFALLGVNNQLARVFGAYYMGTFYIVWFDLEHKIWPTEKRNTH